MGKANRYLKACHDCGGKCCKMGGPNFTEPEMKRVLAAGHQNFFYEARDKIYELNSRADGSCPYLNEDLSCSIHNEKPLICLAWPVFPNYSGKSQKIMLADCPLTKELSPIEISHCCQEAKSIPTILIDVALDYKARVSAAEAQIIAKIFEGFKFQEVKC